MKKRSCITALLAAFAVLLCTVPSHANSAMTKWTGTDTTGVITSDEDCPLVIEKEDLVFEINAVPDIGTSEKKPMSSVTASYTFHNPSDMHVKAHLVFPFGLTPSYGGGGFGMDPEEYRQAEQETYRITLGDEPVTPVLRHTWLGWDAFSVEKDLPLLFEDGTETFWKRDLPVTVYTYEVKDVDLKESSAAAVRATLSADPSKTRFSVFPFNGGTIGESESVVQVWADTGTIRLYVYGEQITDLPEWQFVKAGDSEEEIEGTIELVSQQTATFEEIVFSRYSADCGILEGDYFNAFAHMMESSAEGGIVFEPNSLLLDEDRLMRWYEYDIELDPGQTLVNSVTAPVFPSVDTGYDSPVYEYTYLLSPASTWKEFKDLTVKIHTDLVQIGSTPKEAFTQVSDGYEAHFETLPDEELTFRLCAIENPKKGHGTGWLYAMIFIVPVVLAFILFFVLLIFILKKIFRRRS